MNEQQKIIQGLLEKLPKGEKILAEFFFKEHPNPICINNHCDEEAVHFNFNYSEKEQNEYGHLTVKAYCKKHYIKNKNEELNN